LKEVAAKGRKDATDQHERRTEYPGKNWTRGEESTERKTSERYDHEGRAVSGKKHVSDYRSWMNGRRRGGGGRPRIDEESQQKLTIRCGKTQWTFGEGSFKT